MDENLHICNPIQEQEDQDDVFFMEYRDYIDQIWNGLEKIWKRLKRRDQEASSSSGSLDDIRGCSVAVRSLFFLMIKRQGVSFRGLLKRK